MAMYSHQNQRRIGSRTDRGGFTLVEMLVALALVMLMMTMFATIFQMATGSATKQRIIAESDQRSRQLTTVLRADFANVCSGTHFRSCRMKIPHRRKCLSLAAMGTSISHAIVFPVRQDDIIQFTVDARQMQTNPDDSRFYGALALLFDGIYGTVDGTNPSLPYSPNQPEADDGELVANGTSSSNAAEISLFLRGGNLIRRIMLIRDPLPVAGEDLETQPKSSRGNPYFLTTATSVSGSGLPEFGCKPWCHRTTSGDTLIFLPFRQTCRMYRVALRLSVSMPSVTKAPQPQLRSDDPISDSDLIPVNGDFAGTRRDGGRGKFHGAISAGRDFLR